jgi:hypothetical protein
MVFETIISTGLDYQGFPPEILTHRITREATGCPRFAAAQFSSDGDAEYRHLLIFMVFWQIGSGREADEIVGARSHHQGMSRFRSQETVASALQLSDSGVSDRVNAEIHGVAIKTIRRWRRLYQRTATTCRRISQSGATPPRYWVSPNALSTL